MTSKFPEIVCRIFQMQPADGHCCLLTLLTMFIKCCRCRLSKHDRQHSFRKFGSKVNSIFNYLIMIFLYVAISGVTPILRNGLLIISFTCRMPPTLIVHFVEGLPGGQLSNYDFQFDAATYAVTGLIQRKNSPNHFIAWIRDVSSKYYDATGTVSSNVFIVLKDYSFR